MAKDKKSVQIGVFHILKSVMDVKAKPLHRLVDLGKRAAQEEVLINERIGNLYSYISSNRYDRESVRDAEYDIAEYETEAAAIRQRIVRGNQAEKDLEHVAKFNKVYDTIVNGDQIAKIQDARRVIEDRIARLDDKIFACQVNMVPGERDAETVAQAEHDIAYYEKEYNDLIAQRDALTKQIVNLQNQK